MKYLYKFILSIVFLALIPGCDNSLDSFDEERGLYSIYGYLDLNQEVNYVRVKDLNKPLTRSSTDNIDATVTLENINENIVETLQDSLVQFEDIYTHNFRTTMEINPGTEYKVTAERSDGESVSATATTPQIADVEWGPTDEYCTVPIDIVLEPVKNKYDLELAVGFDYQKIRYWVYPEVSHFENETILYRFTPLNLLNTIFGEGPDSDPIRCWQLDNENLYVKFTHFGPDFGSSSSGSPDIPDETVTFGALYKESFSFTVDTTYICRPNC